MSDTLWKKGILDQAYTENFGWHKLTSMMNGVNDKDYAKPESIPHVENDMWKVIQCVCSKPVSWH